MVARTPSTQDIVRTVARSGAPEGYCCVAAEQTAGRGRLGRSWVAPAGAALLMSILLRPRNASPLGITLAAGLAVAGAVETVTAVPVGLDWPNDVVYEGAKLAGILAEVVPGAEPTAVVLGIGVNLSVEEFPAGARGTSLHRLVTPPPTWDLLLTRLLPALADRLRRLEDGGVPALREEWRRRAVSLGHPVHALGPTGPVEGTALDMAEDGALLVQTTRGPVRIIAGEVLPIRPP